MLPKVVKCEIRAYGLTRSGTSFRDKVLGITAIDIEECPAEEMDEDFKDSNVTVIPVIDFSNQLEQKLAKKWKPSVII